MTARPLWVLGLVGAGALAWMAASGAEPAPTPMPTGPLGRWFTWEDFTRSAAARRIGDPNVPPPEAQAAIRVLVATVLDPLCDALGRKVRITSGYRSPAVNRAVGGVAGSRHMFGGAADIKVDGVSAEALAAAITRLGVPVYQLRVYPPEHGGHLHLSFLPGKTAN